MRILHVRSADGFDVALEVALAAWIGEQERGELEQAQRDVRNPVLRALLPLASLNFSRPGAQVVAQYFNLVRLGRDGYRRVQQYCRDIASWLAEEIAAIGPYELLSRGRELRRPPRVCVPRPALGPAGPVRIRRRPTAY